MFNVLLSKVAYFYDYLLSVSRYLSSQSARSIWAMRSAGVALSSRRQLILPGILGSLMRWPVVGGGLRNEILSLTLKRLRRLPRLAALARNYSTKWERWSEAEGLRRRAADARRHNNIKKRVTSKPSRTF